MTSSLLKTIAAIFVVGMSAPAQNFDTSGNATLRGNYFVREVLMTGNTSGNVTSASSIIGTANFDGNGNYTFNGQGTSLSGGARSGFSLTGTYKVSSNGFFVMQSIADPTDNEYGGVSAVVGPFAFVASATEGSNVSILVGIPAASTSTINNASFSGNYSAATIDFPGADPNAVRQATFNLAADAAGGLGTVAVTGTGLNLGGTSQVQNIPGVTYSLSGTGSGTVTFGAAANSRLISGTKTFYISADRNIILGGSPNGFDVVVGIRAVSGTSSNATASGIYYMGALEEIADSTGNQIDAFYGSVNSNGGGTSIFHNRIQSLAYAVYDYTVNSSYTVLANGTIVPLDLPYTFTLGVGGQAFLATGIASGGSATYSLTLGLATPKYTGSGVYLNPLGIVNSANFAPITNPIAPNELIALFGTGFTNNNVQAQNLPLPTTLGGVKVTINGQLAPLVYVTPTQIVALVPSAISPDKNVYNATVQVTSNGVASNSVTVYTSSTAPGIYSLGGNAIGPAAAQHSNYSVVGASNPAKPGETIIVYAAGLGAVTPTVPDGSPAPATPPLSTVNTSVYMDFNGVAASAIAFAGLTPTAAGLYQVNVQIPSGTSATPYINLSTQGALTSEVTLNVAGVSGLAHPENHLLQKRAARPKAGVGAQARAQ